MAATSAAIVFSADWRADTDSSRACRARVRALFGMAPRSAFPGPKTGAMLGFAGAMSGPCPSETTGDAARGTTVPLAGVGTACAPAGAADAISTSAAIHVGQTVRIYFFDTACAAAGVDAGAGVGAAGTGSENMTRPLTSS